MNTLNVSNIIGKIRKIKVLLEIVTRKYYLTTDIRHIYIHFKITSYSIILSLISCHLCDLEYLHQIMD